MSGPYKNYVMAALAVMTLSACGLERDCKDIQGELSDAVSEITRLQVTKTNCDLHPRSCSDGERLEADTRLRAVFDRYQSLVKEYFDENCDETLGVPPPGQGEIPDDLEAL